VERSAEVLAQARRLKPAVVQPAIRTHEETGRKALYVSHRIRRFKNMTDGESVPLLELLERHATQDEFVMRHCWSVGDILVWDNRCLIHKALGDFDMWNEPRVMVRASVFGSRSGYYFAGDSVESVADPEPASAAQPAPG